jgi:hypothetical protein
MDSKSNQNLKYEYVRHILDIQHECEETEDIHGHFENYAIEKDMGIYEEFPAYTYIFRYGNVGHE